MENTPESGTAEKKRRNWPMIILKILVTSFLLYMIILAVGLLLFQRKLMYFPQPYIFNTPRVLGLWNINTVEYTTMNGRQVSYSMEYAGGEDNPPVKKSMATSDRTRVWVFFHGNASLALDWALVYLDEIVPENDTRFLLVEYPGYGESEGKTTRESLIENGERSFDQFLQDENLDPDKVDIGIVGYSMGAAAGLEFAVRHPVDRIILFAPYTDMIDMAKRTAPWPHYHLVIDRYDNRERIRELAERNNPPQIRIYHGTEDKVIPVEMGRELAELEPAITVYQESNVADHGNLPDVFSREWLPLLTE